MLSKGRLILEDKIVIENALSLFVGIVLFKRENYGRFTGFQNAGSDVSNAEQLVLAGLLCAEEKVRSDFGRTLTILSIYLNRGEQNALNFLLGTLARNLAAIESRPSRQFFDLLNGLIDKKAAAAADDSGAIYDPEALLNQMIDKILAQ